MKEWSRKNEFNSFNSWKGLLYSEWYKAIIEWRDGEREAAKNSVPNTNPTYEKEDAKRCNQDCQLKGDLRRSWATNWDNGYLIALAAETSPCHLPCHAAAQIGCRARQSNLSSELDFPTHVS